MSRICFKSYNVGGEEATMSCQLQGGDESMEDQGTSLSLWSLFEIVHNNYNKKGDFEPNFDERTFCSPLDGK